jgi:ATP/maltotriose-dependent transcriptional regulator MalT
VKSHAMAIYRKLNATSRNEGVEQAHELGLL